MFVMNHPAFISGNFDTKFVENYFHPDKKDENEAILAVALSALLMENSNQEMIIQEEGNIQQNSDWFRARQ